MCLVRAVRAHIEFDGEMVNKRAFDGFKEALVVEDSRYVSRILVWEKVSWLENECEHLRAPNESEHLMLLRAMDSGNRISFVLVGIRDDTYRVQCKICFLSCQGVVISPSRVSYARKLGIANVTPQYLFRFAWSTYKYTSDHLNILISLCISTITVLARSNILNIFLLRSSPTRGLGLG